MRQVTNTEQATKDLGKKLSARLRGGDVVALYGELGAGKTTLVKGLAEGLGITEDIMSPTFALMNIHKVQSPKSKVQSLVHIDTYRLKNEQELMDIGVEDYLGQPDTITVIEWPEKIANLLAKKQIYTITLEHGGANHRLINHDLPLKSKETKK